MSFAGLAFILLSAAGFGSMALFAHTAFADGVSTETLVFLRFLIGAIIIGSWLFARGIVLPRGRALAGYLLLGGMYSVGAWCYFSALRYASSGLVALLLYTYPLFVAVFAAVLGIDRFGRREGIATVCATGGLLLALGSGAAGGQLLGIVLGIVSGLIYAIYIVTGSRLGERTPPLSAAFVVLCTGAACHAAYGSIKGFALPQSSNGWLALLAIGSFGAALAIAAFFAGLKRIGPTRASLLSTVEPPITIALGFFFLGEQLGWPQLIGGSAILAAALLLASPRREPAATAA